MKYFETRFLEEADEFLSSLDPKVVKKIFYLIDLAQRTNDPKLFKKLKGEFGSFALGTPAFRLGFWHFGTKLIKWKLW